MDPDWVPAWIAPLPGRAVAGGRTIFLSDLHLGSGADDRLRRDHLLGLLGTLPGRIDDLVLGGDIFEFWWEWRHSVPSLFFDVLHGIRDVSRAGVRVRFVAGNHDFAVGDALADFCQATVDPDGICLDIGGKLWLLVHGDAAPPSERLDRLARRVMRSRWARAAWNLLPADISFRTALGVGKASRWLEPGPAPSTAEMEPMARAWMRKYALAGVVHGHTHRALATVGPEGTYVNNGDWVVHRSAVWISGTGARLVDCAREGHPWESSG